VKVALVCSSGGHLAQLHRLHPWWSRNERLWVTFDTPDTLALLADEPVVWAHHPTTRNLPNAIRNLGLAVRILMRERPDVVVSDGAGVAFPFFLVANIVRAKTVSIEAYDRIDSRTLTGRLCAPITDLFSVHWEEQRRLYPRAKLIGALL
jgi:hypothetical protein